MARVEEDRKVLDDLPTLVGRGRNSGAPHGPSSSQVSFKCGSNDHRARDCPKVDDGSSNPKKRNLGAYAHGATILTILVMKSVHQTRFRLV